MSRMAHERTPAPPRLAVLAALAVLGLAAAVASVVLVAGDEEIREPRARALLVGWIVAAYAACGLIAWSRRPESRLGPLMVAAAFGPFVSVLGEADADLLHTIGEGLRLLPVALFLHVFLSYPTGRLDRPIERVVIVAGYAASVGLGIVWILLGGLDEAATLTVVDAPGAADVVRLVQRVSVSAITLVGLGVLVAKRRRAGRALRRSRELLVDSFLLALLLLPVGLLAQAFGAPGTEVIVFFAFGMIGISPIVFLSGLLGARLARAAVGDLVVELAEDPSPDALQGALGRALGDPSLSLAYWLPDFMTYADLEGRPVSVPNGEGRAATFIDHDGTRVAALLHDPALLDEPERLEAVTAAAGIALDNARLHAQLRARVDEIRGSRARVLEAGEQERKRLERDLHDGAQQRLVALSLELALIEKSLAADPAMSARLDQARQEVASSLEELRDLAQGLHPAVVGGHGLAVGLESLAARAPIPVKLDVDLGERLPERLEVAAFYLVSESLANVAKHAQASSAAVDVTRDNGMLVVEVRDDGVGGADTERGSGLRGLADRVEALDGRLRVWSPEGEGTRVRAEIPCAS
jgi:signal transduction histidine kinase